MIWQKLLVSDAGIPDNLDNYQTNIVGCYSSFRTLRTGYAGSYFDTTTIYDQSTNTIDFISSNPELVSGTRTGVAAMVFNGSTQDPYIASSDGLFGGLFPSAFYMCISVYLGDQSSTDSTFQGPSILTEYKGYWTLVQYKSAGTNYVRLYSYNYGGPSVAYTPGWNVIEIWGDSSGASIRINGGTPATDANNWTPTPLGITSFDNYLIVGVGQYSTAGTFNGYLGEMAIYNAIPSDSDKTAIRDILTAGMPTEKIKFVGANTSAKLGATSGTSTIALNSGLTGGIASAVQEGDLVIAVFGTGSTADRTLSITDGTNNYTLIGSELYANSTFDTNLRVGYKRMTSTPDASTTFGATGNTADSGAMAVFVLRGVDASTPIDVTVTTGTATNTSRADPPTITPSTVGAMVVNIVAAAHNGGVDTFTSTDLTNFVTVGGLDDTNDVTIGIGIGKDYWTSGAVNPGAVGHTQADSTGFSWAAISVALRPA